MKNQEYILKGLEEKMNFTKEEGVAFRCYFRKINELHEQNSRNIEGLENKIVRPILKENNIEKNKCFMALLDEGFTRFMVFNCLEDLYEEEHIEFVPEKLGIGEIKDPEKRLNLSQKKIDILTEYKRLREEFKLNLDKVEKELWDEFVEPILGDKEKLEKILAFMPECPSRFEIFMKLNKKDSY